MPLHRPEYEQKRNQCSAGCQQHDFEAAEEARAETKRLHKSSEMQDMLIRGWSDSDLARPDPLIEKAAQKKTLFGKRMLPVMPTNAVPAGTVSTNTAPVAAQ